MTILNPKALIWAWLAAPIVLLYVWRLRPRQQVVATGFLWERLFGTAQRRSAWWPLRRPVSLCLQLALLALLCVALAEPHVGPPQTLVMVLDNSASMNATDAQPTRLDQAKARARNLMAALGYRDRLAIVSAGGAIRVHCGLTGRRDTLEEALRAVGPTRGATRVPEAVALARRLLAGDPAGRIIVLSDGGFDGADGLARQRDVRWITVGGAGQNVAITALAARRNPDDPERCQVFVELTSFAAEPLTCRVELRLDGKPVGTMPAELPAAGTWRHVFEMAAPQGGSLLAGLDRSDAFAIDNSASVMLPPLGITSGGVSEERAPDEPLVASLPPKAESDIRVPAGLASLTGEPPAGRPGPTLWLFPAGAALLLILAEWFLFQRRWTC